MVLPTWSSARLPPPFVSCIRLFGSSVVTPSTMSSVQQTTRPGLPDVREIVRSDSRNLAFQSPRTMEGVARRCTNKVP